MGAYWRFRLYLDAVDSADYLLSGLSQGITVSGAEIIPEITIAIWLELKLIIIRALLY
ncbi:MAG: hypothetical protein A4E71_02831 [Smithella sp. PtaU1.Bin162]|nr:MAG: hypothetical protein A4E71_02831 [Smithella sp. PtaU1.Bin162]